MKCTKINWETNEFVVEVFISTYLSCNVMQQVKATDGFLKIVNLTRNIAEM